jgi:hypothetical protein
MTARLLKSIAITPSPESSACKRHENHGHKVEWQKVRHKKVHVKEHRSGTMGGTFEWVPIFDIQART